MPSQGRIGAVAVLATSTLPAGLCSVQGAGYVFMLHCTYATLAMPFTLVGWPAGCDGRAEWKGGAGGGGSGTL